MPSRKPTEAARPPLVAELAQASPEFATATDAFQDAIVELLERHAKDGQVTLYPARDAWVDGVARETQTVPLAVAAGYLAHVPPPFYLDEASWRANGLLAEGPFFRDPEPVEALPEAAPSPVGYPFATGGRVGAVPPFIVGESGPETLVPAHDTDATPG